MSSLPLISKQFAKYIAVGGMSNGLAYGLYIIITFSGVSPIIAMSIVYVFASVIAFTANKGWTFQSNTNINKIIIRYLMSQVLGYGTNLILLYWLHYVLGVPHQTAQLLGIGIVAVVLFLISRYYVFS
jgi:putative flippase GtrA